MKNLMCALSLSMLLLWSASAQAVFLDPYDNALFADGLYGSVYANLYTSDERTDSRGDKVGDTDFSALVTTVRASYYKTLLNVPVVFQVGIPFGEVREKKTATETSTGLGDIWFGPGVFLYKNPETSTYLSYWFYAYAPTGEFDKNHSYSNMGWNHWYFENQLAFSKVYGKFILDANINHFFHAEEKDNQVETPDRLELEGSLAYQVTDKFIAGLNLEGHWDLGDYKVAGATLQDSGATRYEVGPVVGYTFNDKLSATLRWNHDVSSKNDLKGDSYWLRLAYTF